MSILVGIIAILLSVLTPNFFSIGIYWSISLAVMFGLVCGVTGKFRILKFTIGVVSGILLFVFANFENWVQLAPLYAAFHTLPIFSAIIGFAIGHVFSPTPNENT